MEEKNVIKEKAIDVVDFEEVKNRKGQSETMDSYFAQKDIRVTRGELYQIMEQIMGNIDKELMESFKRVVMTHNLVDVVVQALVQKELLSDEDLSKAQEALVAEVDKMTAKGEKDNGSK